MANNSKQTLVQRIALDGGAEIEKELKAIGAEGEAAFKKLKASAESLATAGTGLNTFFSKLRKDIDTISKGAKQVATGFQTIGRATADVVGRITILTAAVTGAAVSLVLLTKSAAEFVDVQNKAAQATGLSIKEYGRLQFAFEQGNIAADEFTVAMKPFNKAITDAAKGTGPAAEVFKKFGVAVKNADGSIRPTESILADLADAFAKIPDSAAKSAAATTLFGRAGAKIIPILDDGGAALRGLGDDAERVGRVFTKEQAVVGDAFGDALNRMSSSVKGIRTQLLLGFAPAFTTAFDAVTEIIIKNRTAILAFGTTIANQIIPLIKDFVAILEGRDTDVVNKNLLGIRDTIVSIASAFEAVAAVVSTAFTIIENTLQPIVDLVNLLIDGFNALFGQHIGHINAATLIFIAIMGEFLGIFRAAGLLVRGGIAIFEGLSTAFGATTAKVVAFIAQGLLLQGLLRTLVNDVLLTLHNSLDAIGKAFQDLGKLITDTFKTVLDDTLGFFKQIIDGANAVISTVAKALGGGGDKGPAAVPGHKDGGPITGAGTGTSDSILSWLSNGEFVVRAAAVRRLGVGLLNSLNSGLVPRFADGGLVHSAAGGFDIGKAAASGGGGRPINLTIGDEIFEGLLAPDAVADKLVRFANTRNTRRAAAAPSWK